MSELPILFSAPMVRAILEGRKTQTRRMITPQPALTEGSGFAWKGWLYGRGFSHDQTVKNFAGDCCPYGKRGDRLRVKEAAWIWCERVPNGTTRTGRQKWRYEPLRSAPIQYVADHPDKPALNVVSPETGNLWGWRLKIGRFLPRWASRITLEVTGVRVERLQDITQTDAVAEGCAGERSLDTELGLRVTPREQFHQLWEQLNGAGAWDTNPWVWVVEFKRIEQARKAA